MALTEEQWFAKFGYDADDSDLTYRGILGNVINEKKYEDEIKIRGYLRHQLRIVFKNIKDSTKLTIELAEGLNEIIDVIGEINIVNNRKFSTWLKSLKSLSYTDNKLLIIVPLDGYQELLCNYYSKLTSDEGQGYERLYKYFSRLLREDIEKAKETFKSNENIQFELLIITENDAGKYIDSYATLNNEADFPNFTMDKLIE